MMYTVSWYDRKGVLFRVSFPRGDDADLYLESLRKTVETFNCHDDFKDVKRYPEFLTPGVQNEKE